MRNMKAVGPVAEPTATTTTRIAQAAVGCPCGCRTWPPFIDDPDCVRHQPLGVGLAECGGEFGPDGKFREHCGRSVA